MTTHYEVLGVAEDATTEEIRQAYVAVAKATHPDRRGADDPVTRARADAAIKAANLAWATLRDPSRRAAYDRSLRHPPASGSSGSSSAGSASSASSGAASGPTRRAAAGVPASGVPVPSSWAPWLRLAPVVIVVAILAAILVFSAYAAQNDASGPNRPPTTTAVTYPVGTCILIAALPTGPVPVKAPCGSGNSAVVSSVTATPRPCPPDTRPLDLDDGRTTLCLKSAP